MQGAGVRPLCGLIESWITYSFLALVVIGSGRK